MNRAVLRGSSLALAVACAWFVPETSQASLLRTMPVAELSRLADRIVVARVLSIASSWNATHTRIRSIVEVEVDDAWKGDARAGQRIRVIRPGGVVGDVEMAVQGMPAFATGEKVLLFLKRDHVLGLSQGKRAMRWDGAARRWLVAPPSSEGVVGARDPAADRPLDEVRAEVQAATGR